MSRTITALYDTRAEAEAARERLTSAVDVEGKARIVDQSSIGSEQQEQNDFRDIPISDEDRHSYREGLRRGGFMLCAEVDGDEDADQIISILEETSSVDLDDRQNSWREEGWAPYGASTGGSAQATGTFHGQPIGQSDIGGSQEGELEEAGSQMGERAIMPGRRDVDRGSGRVRSYSREMSQENGDDAESGERPVFGFTGSAGVTDAPQTDFQRSDLDSDRDR